MIKNDAAEDNDVSTRTKARHGTATAIEIFTNADVSEHQQLKQKMGKARRERTLLDRKARTHSQQSPASQLHSRVLNPKSQ